MLTLGGLYVLGTERHEARRIDNQLRGRSGRQGDVGESRFFLSLEDDLLRRDFSVNALTLPLNDLARTDEVPVIDLVADIRASPQRAPNEFFIAYDEVDFPGASGHYTAAGNRSIAERLLTHMRAVPGLATLLDDER